MLHTVVLTPSLKGRQMKISRNTHQLIENKLYKAGLKREHRRHRRRRTGLCSQRYSLRRRTR